jgi:hypothetical protein
VSDLDDVLNATSADVSEVRNKNEYNDPFCRREQGPSARLGRHTSPAADASSCAETQVITHFFATMYIQDM